MLKNSLNFYLEHLSILLYPFEAITGSEDILVKLQNGHFRSHYVSEFCLMGGILVDTGIQYSFYGNDFRNPTQFQHVFMKFMPEFFLERSNISVLVTFVLLLICYGFLILDSFPHLKNVLVIDDSQIRYFDEKHDKIDNALGVQLVEFYFRFKRLARKFAILMAVQTHMGFTFSLFAYEFYGMFTSGWVYFPSFRTILVALICPFVFNSVISLILMVIHFIGQVCMISIRQRLLISRINKDLQIFNFRLRLCYSKTLVTLRETLNLTLSIDSFNVFYGRYNTVWIAMFTLITCSNINVVIEEWNKAPPIMLMPWFAYGSNYASMIFLLSFVCSKTLALNMRLFKRLRELQALATGSRFYRCQIVKLDLVNEYKILLQKCGFRLWTSAPINNRLFGFHIFIYASVFYLKLASQKLARR